MARKGKLKYDFDTISVLEVEMGGKWYRVTSITFRSFDGNRRVNGIEYTGPVFMYGFNTEVPYTNSSKIIYDPASLPLVGENQNYMKRGLP